MLTEVMSFPLSSVCVCRRLSQLDIKYSGSSGACTDGVRPVLFEVTTSIFVETKTPVGEEPQSSSRISAALEFRVAMSEFVYIFVVIATLEQEKY